MQIVERHGGGSHFVRPDRVYRTGVLTSTMGYDPGADVQSVAAAFTAYPMDLGLGYPGAGIVDRIRMKFAAWKARRALSGLGMVPNVAYARVGAEIAPHMVSKETMLAHLMQGSLPENFARSQVQSSWHSWARPWWAPR